MTPTKPIKEFCICGRGFTTSSGAKHHYAACPQEQARSAAYVTRIEAENRARTTYQHPHAMGMETERKIAAELMRDLLVDWIPEYEGDDQTTDCQCSAHRARRYVRAAGIELRGPTTTNAPNVRPSS